MRVFSKYSDPIQAAPSSHSIHTTTGWPAGYLAHYINQTCSVMESTYDLSTNDQHNQCVESILCKLSVKLCSRRFDLFRLAPLLTNSQFLSPDLNLNGTTICCCSAIASRRVLFISRPILPEGWIRQMQPSPDLQCTNRHIQLTWLKRAIVFSLEGRSSAWMGCWKRWALTGGPTRPIREINSASHAVKAFTFLGLLASCQPKI